MEQKRIIRSVTGSLSRLQNARSQVASATEFSSTKKNFDKLTKPKSPSSTMKKVGVALIVGTPDPITAVPGVALIAASLVLKKKEPTKLDDIASEARRVLRDLQSLSL